MVDKNGNPKGGKWSFDEDNRKKLPKNIKLPKQIKYSQSPHTEKIKKLIDKEFKTHPGDVKDFWIGTERKDARSTLRNFINFKLNLFGDYEDSVDERDNILFHSALSPFINIGLLTPQEILDEVSKSGKNKRRNSLEGYIRQLIGWREFMLSLIHI